MTNPSIRREIAMRYHRALPDAIRGLLKRRGIPATVIEEKLLGWDEARVTIPIFDRHREVIGFRYARVPEANDAPIELTSDFTLGTELYGVEKLSGRLPAVILCEDEIERLILEGQGYGAVCSTGGPAAFRPEWESYFRDVKRIHICFRRTLEGAAAAEAVRRLLPQARIATLPPDVGLGGGFAEFFGVLGRTRVDLEVVLMRATNDEHSKRVPPKIRTLRPRERQDQRRIEAVRRSVRLHEVVANFLTLRASDGYLIGHCPFHGGNDAAFMVYSDADVYRCSVCHEEGDVVQFLMNKESMSLREALDALERFQLTHELYGVA